MKKELIIGILLVFVFSFIPLFWFKGNMVMVGHDNVFPLNFNEFLLDRFFTWSEHHGTGYDQSSGMGSIIIHIIDVFPSWFDLSVQTTQKFVYCFWFFALLFSSFLFAFYLKRFQLITTNYFMYFFPVLYTFNFYTLQGWWIGERTKFSVMVFLPLFFILLFSSLQNSRKTAILAIIAAFLLSIFNAGGFRGTPLWGGLLVGVVTLFLYSMIFPFFQQTRRATIKTYVFFFVYMLLGALLLNFYHLLPFLSHTLESYSKEIIRIGGAASTFGWIDVISENASYINLFRFQGIPEWYTSLDHPYGQAYIKQPFLVVASYIFIFLILLILLFKKKEHEKQTVYFFFFLFVIGLFFTAGSHPPFGFLYKALTNYIPGFAIFRSPIYKFGYIYWFAGSALIAYSLSVILDKIESGITKKFLYTIPLAIIINCLILFYHYPFVTGNIFSWSRGDLSSQVEVPQYVFDFADWFKSKHVDARILLLPRANDNWTGDTYQWKFFSLYPLLANLSRDAFIYNNDSLTANERVLVNRLYDAILDNDKERITLFTQILGIKYFVVRDDFYYTLPWSPTEPPLVYKQAMEQNDMFSFIKSFDKWHIYALKDEYLVQNDQLFITPLISLYSQQDANADTDIAGLVEIMDKHWKEKKLDNNHLLLANKSENMVLLPKENIATIRKVFTCIACKQLEQTTDIEFPSLRVLPNSPLYQFIESSRNKEETLIQNDEQKLQHELGKSLIYLSELKNLGILFGVEEKGSIAILDVSRKLSKSYEVIELILEKYHKDPVKNITNNLLVIDYLDAEEKELGNIITRNRDKKFTDYLIEPYNKLKQLNKQVSSVVKGYDTYQSKHYFPQLEENTYDIEIFLQDQYYNPGIASAGSSLTISKNKVYPQAQNGQLLSFGKQTLKTDDFLTYHMNNSRVDEGLKQTQYSPKKESNDNICYGKTVSSVNPNEIYRVNVNIINNISDKLKFSVLVTKKYSANKTFMPFEEKYILRDDDSIQKLQYVYIPTRDVKDVFFGICSTAMSRDMFQIVVKQFDVFELFSPLLIAYQLNDKANNNIIMPQNVIEKKDQTKYTIRIVDAKQPFFVGLLEKYNVDWKLYVVDNNEEKNMNNSWTNRLHNRFFNTLWLSPIDEKNHFMANGYHNGWFIDKSGSYSIIIEYKPQKLFYFGLLLSSLSVVILGGFLLYQFIKNKKL